jgi:Ca2+-binding EF-hand superfamily protein
MVRYRIMWPISVCVAGLAAFAATSPAIAQQPASQPPVSSPGIIAPGAQLLTSRMRVGQTLEQYLDNLKNDFFQLDADGDGKLAQRDVALHGLFEGTLARMVGLSSVFGFDLDGDGAVTEDEIRKVRRYQLRAQLGLARFNAAGKAQVSAADNSEKEIENTVRMIMALDTNKDGKVDFSEATRYSQAGGIQRNSEQFGPSAQTRQALTLDQDSKGEIVLTEYQAAGEALFRKIDSDNDGKLSQQELTEYRRQPNPPDAAMVKAANEAVQKREREQAEAARKRREAEAAAQAGCDMPTASENAKVVLLSAYETDALSSVTLGSQDTVVHAGNVVVEPGSEPLFIVIATYGPTIWKFSGAVGRIERLVMTSSLTGANSRDAARPPLVGATGIPRERITFFAKPNCMNYFSETPSSSSLQAAGTIKNKAGKAPDVVAAKYSVGSFSVPSGKIETLREKGQQPLVIQKSQGSLNIVGDASNIIIQSGPSRARDEMDRFFPGGVTQIDPKLVVADVPVAVYEVLPSQAGLVQLLTTGALTQNRAGEYIVRQKIRFPAGLAGAHSVTFLVMKGTPYPDGDPAHSCVIVEDTGESKGANCRTR